MSDNQALTVDILVKPIGYLAINQGTVDLHSGDGEVHTLADDIMVFYEDTVVVNNAASGKIVFFNGLSEDIVFGPGDVVRIKDEVFVSSEQDDLAALAQNAEAEIAALQNAILAGEDPSEIQEAPAAGEQFFQYSLGQSYSVNIDRNAIYSLANYGFDTQGNPLDHLSLPNFGYLTQGVLRNINPVDETQNEGSINNAVEETLTYSIEGAAPTGFILDTVTGAWTFDTDNAAYRYLAAGEVENLEVIISISDASGNIVEQIINIAVTGTNDVPTATANITTQAAAGDGLVTGSVDAIDVDGDTLSYSLVEDVAGFVLDAETGEWSFDPTDEAYVELALGEEAEVVVSVVVSDGNGGTTQQDITLNLVGTNDAPVVDATNTVDASDIAEVVTGSVDATDVDGDTLSYELVEEVAGFTLDAETGEWSFDPSDEAYAELALAETAEVVASVVVSDGNGGTTQQDITLNLVGTNDAPVADATNNVDASGHVSTRSIPRLVVGSVGATDADGDTLSYAVVEDVDGFDINPDTGVWTFDPSDEAYAELAEGETAEVVVSVVVSDGNGGTTQQDITLNLVGTNDAPVADATNTIDASNIAEVVTGSVDATDVDGDTLAYALVEAVAGFTLNPETGEWSFDPSDDAYAELAVGEEAEVVVSVVVSDGNGGTTQQDITLNLVGTNDAPVADATKTVDASDIAEIVSGSVDATDVDGDTLAYELVEAVAGFTLDSETGEWSFDPSNEAYAELAVGEEAEVVVSVVVSDGNGTTTQQDITLNLVGTNDAPVADATNTVDASDIAEVVTGSVDATDVDGDTLTYALVEEIDGFTLNTETGEWSFDPSDEAYAELALAETAEVVASVVVSDGNGGTTQQDITLNLVGTNDAPVADATNNVDASGHVSTRSIPRLVVGSVGATDADGDTLSYAVVEDVDGFDINPDTGVWTFDPSDEAYAELAEGETAEVVVSVVVSDGNGGTTQQDITLNLVGTNDAPVADATNTVDASDIAEVVTGSVDATDVDGDTLTYALVEEVAGFTLDAETGEWSFDPSDEAYAELAVGEEAEVVVSVVVSDGNGGTTQQDITLNLVGTNDAPVADATNTVDASDIATVVTGSVDVTDVDGDTLSYELVEEIDGFTLNPETGEWSFDPSDEAYAELA
ncbi:retention module-containing protein, partial [Marinomonas dokdonensis]|uniref:retention module-containing protein n=1 Tax=Marinomonas dokdonensis TaxID=328224 RepID=UPI00405566FB